MKRLILCAAFAVAGLSGAHAQHADSLSRGEWLPCFTQAEVDGAFDITFERVPASQAPRIDYVSENPRSRLRAEVRDGVLRIRERSSSDAARTRICVRYNELQSLEAVDAFVTLADTLRAGLADIVLAGRARLTGVFDVDDLDMDITGRSEATLRGRARYLTLGVSTGRAEAAELECFSARVCARSNASATVRATDRLEAAASTGGTVRYAGRPAIVRTRLGFMSGAIRPLE